MGDAEGLQVPMRWRLGFSFLPLLASSLPHCFPYTRSWLKDFVFASVLEVEQPVFWRRKEVLWSQTGGFSSSWSCSPPRKWLRSRSTWDWDLSPQFLTYEGLEPAVFLWLCQVFVVACRIFDLRCCIWHLVFWLGIEPGPPALGARSLSHWIIGEIHNPLSLN